MRNRPGEERILALIPARAGSKGVPRKNLRPLGGIPLIAWTIQAALKSDSMDSVVVTTDDLEIAEVAREHGASVPFIRPADLAADETPMVDTVLHALGEVEALGDAYDFVALLQPTSPLRTEHHIDAAVRLLKESGSEAVVSVCETEHSPLLTNTLPENRRMGEFLHHEAQRPTRQELPVFYRLNGAIYLISVQALRRERAFIGEFAVAYVMPPEASVDIDSELDFVIAEALATRS